MGLGKVLMTSGSSAIQVADDFNRADSTGLGLTSDGNYLWYRITSDSYYSAYTFTDFNIVSNKAVKSSASSTTSMNSAMLSIGVQNFDASANFYRSAKQYVDPSFMFRCATTGGSQFSSGVHIVTVSDLVYVFEWDGGTRYTTASASVSMTNDFLMRVKLVGTSCDVWVNGTLAISTTLTRGAAGGGFGFGWAQYTTQTFSFDNLTISGV